MNKIMSERKPAMHYVCTREQGRALVRAHTRFFVSNCGCREKRGGCGRSRPDVCLAFHENAAGAGSGRKEVTAAEVEALFSEAERAHLVVRPFRNEARTAAEGICFCCDDCCYYFQGAEAECDHGEAVEHTSYAECNLCGACVEACHFHARRLEGEELRVDRTQCYGCGLCRDACPLNCIEMVPRAWRAQPNPTRPGLRLRATGKRQPSRHTESSGKRAGARVLGGSQAPHCPGAAAHPWPQWASELSDGE